MTDLDSRDLRLIGLAVEFVGALGEIVNGTVTSHHQTFVMQPYAGQARVWIFPHQTVTPAELAPIPITAGLAADEDPQLFLRVGFVAGLDTTEEHLLIESSVMALLVKTRRDKPPRPVVRLEYERGKGSEPDDPRPGSHRRSAAHVQIHGTSAELAAVQTIRGHPLTGLDALHIPVGGRRFRPSLEDFIEFLAVHDLISVHDGWPAVIAHHRGDWLRRQLKAAVRNDPETAAEQLIAMGWPVQPPQTR